MSLTISSKSLQDSLGLARQRILEWRRNPARFVTEAIGATPDDWQANTLQLLADHDKVSVRSCHGPGKSTLDSWAVLWFLSCYYPAKVPCTAPTLHQLRDILWSELATWHSRMNPVFRDQFAIRNSDQDLRFYLKSSPSESFAVGRTGRKENPEALQGFHSENLLFVVDEASGVDEIVFEVAQGALSTSHAKVMMTSNPTRTSGYFHRSHHGMRDRWKTVRIGAGDSPRVTDQYASDVAAAYGIDSNVYRVRVLGEFPRESDDSVISLDLCEMAKERDVSPIETADEIWGVDVARFGDDASALVKRKGNVVKEAKSWKGKDTMQTAGIIVDEYRETMNKPAVICVDVIGLGAGVVDRLRELKLPARGVNVAESPAVKARYMRLRDELWFETREWLEARDVKLPDDDELIGQLTVPRYTMTSTGKIKVEGKDEIKSRGVRSPDIADALCLTFAKVGTSNMWKPIEYTQARVV